MKRIGGLYLQICDYLNLRIAFRKAARGKQARPDVIYFRHSLDQNLEKLRVQLLSHTPDIGHYHFFEIQDPKRRLICAADFPERVLHHAIMNIVEPVLEKYAIHDSFACRKEKGLHRAVSRAQEFSRRFDWYLKLDIRKYFNSIDHGIMLRLLKRRIKDQELMTLFSKLLDSYHTLPGKGMPIGNLISQHLANFYLGVMDHFIKEEMGVSGYLRYMDDFILFSPDHECLKDILNRLTAFLRTFLALELKENIQLNRCRHGFPFLGMRIFPHQIRLTPGSKQRFILKFKRYERKWSEGRWMECDLARHMGPLIEFTKTADAYGFRTQVIQRWSFA